MFDQFHNVRTYGDVIIGTIIALVIAVVIGVFTIGPTNIRRGSVAYHWQKAEGKVISSKIIPKKEYLVLQVDFSYKFAGKDYTARRALSEKYHQGLHRLHELYQPGTSIEYLVSPDDPTQVMLEREYIDFEIFLVIGISIVIIALGSCLVMLLLIRRRKQRVDYSIWKKRSRRKFYLSMAGGVIALIIGLMFFYIVGIMNFIKAWRQYDRIEAEAKIINCRIEKKRENNYIRRDLVLEYEYTFQNKQYKSSQFSVWEEDIRSLKNKRDIVGKYNLGETYTCYVMPDDPENAVLLNHTPWGLVGGLVPLFIVVAGVFIIRNALIEQKMELFVPDEENLELEVEGEFEEDEFEEDDIPTPESIGELKYRAKCVLDREYRKELWTDLQLVLLGVILIIAGIFYYEIENYMDFLNPASFVGFFSVVIGVGCAFKHMFKRNIRINKR